MGTRSYHWVMDPLSLSETFGEALTAWKRDCLASGQSMRTITSRAYTLRRLAAAGVDPMTATRDELTEWLANLRDSRTGRVAAKSSMVTYRAQIRAFCGWLVDTGRRADDPALKPPRPKSPRGVPRPLTSAQVEAILAACADHRARQTRAYVILAAYAGLRVHEIAQVRGEDVQHGELWVDGKGGTRSSLPMHPALAALAGTMPTRGWWFPTDSIEGHVHRCSVSSAIKRAMVRADVPGTPHALRHHYGTQVLIASGGNLRVTQRALRHASPATTAIYTQVPDDSLRMAIAGIPA